MRRIAWLALLAAVMLLALGFPGCDKQPQCTGGLQPYKGNCLSNMAIEYVGCTKGRGINTTSEISGGVGGTLRVVANASLNLAYKKSKQENTPVALEIVRDCMEIAKQDSAASDPEQRIATSYQSTFDQAVKDWQAGQVKQTPTVTLSSSSAKIGDQVTVSGSNFWPNEGVDITLQAALVAQVTADAQGSFSTVITVPSSAPPPNFDTAISASGQTSAKSARARFHTAP